MVRLARGRLAARRRQHTGSATGKLSELPRHLYDCSVGGGGEWQMSPGDRPLLYTPPFTRTCQRLEPWKKGAGLVLCIFPQDRAKVPALPGKKRWRAPPCQAWQSCQFSRALTEGEAQGWVLSGRRHPHPAPNLLCKRLQRSHQEKRREKTRIYTPTLLPPAPAQAHFLPK